MSMYDAWMLGASSLTEADLRQLASVAFMAGALGVLVMCTLMAGLSSLWSLVSHHADKQARIRDARWRARWQGFLGEARAQGLRGREAVLWAANAMRTHREALRLLAEGAHV